jgi:hypothetical protein
VTVFRDPDRATATGGHRRPPAATGRRNRPWAIAGEELLELVEEFVVGGGEGERLISGRGDKRAPRKRPVR